MLTIKKGMIPTLQLYDPTGLKIVFKFEKPHIFFDGYMTKEDARLIEQNLERKGYDAEIVPSFGAKGYPWNVWVSVDKVKRIKSNKKK